MRNLSPCAVLASLVALAPLYSHADEAVAYKVVIQVSDNDLAKWNLALNNAKNIQQALGKNNATVEIVAYGPGIDMLKLDSEVGSRLSEAADSGVLVAACANTMRAHKLTAADMHPAAQIVPSGVVEIIRREREGYAYIRP
jgi:uncharacterized protein